MSLVVLIPMTPNSCSKSGSVIPKAIACLLYIIYQRQHNVESDITLGTVTIQDFLDPHFVSFFDLLTKSIKICWKVFQSQWNSLLPPLHLPSPSFHPPLPLFALLLLKELVDWILNTHCHPKENSTSLTSLLLWRTRLLLPVGQDLLCRMMLQYISWNILTHCTFTIYCIRRRTIRQDPWG